MDTLLLDRLHVLNYRQAFCTPRHLPPLGPGYFTRPFSNPHAQLMYFYALFAWLVQLCGEESQFKLPGDMDDPNMILSNLVQTLKHANIQGEFNPLVLKQGYGETVVLALMGMADRAIQKKGIFFASPIFHDEDELEEAETHDDAELKLDEVALDPPPPAPLMDEDRRIMEIHEGFHMDPPNPKDVGPSSFASTRPMSQESWQQELNRVLPTLKVHVPTHPPFYSDPPSFPPSSSSSSLSLLSSTSPWSLHVTQLHSCVDPWGLMHPPTPTPTPTPTPFVFLSTLLHRLIFNFTDHLDQVRRREAMVTTHFQTHIETYQTLQQGLSTLKFNYHQHTEAMAKVSKELTQVTEQLDAMK
ncbi:Intraflagellar transport protein 57, partial [Coelomomyces lativittatus]